ncbi:MAG: ribonuclease R, partial [Bacteroidales bacterium]|nr:ribonuclease R [Bacteroidales bacterium]
MAKSKKGKGSGNQRMTREEMIKRIEKFFKERPSQIYNYKQVARGIGANSEPARIDVAHLLNQMKNDMFLVETDPGRFRRNPKRDLREGVFQRKQSGHVIIPDGGGEPLAVKEEDSLHALSGDRVKYSLLTKRRRHDLEARVQEIIERADNSYVGILEVKKHYAFLTPNTRTLEYDIYIPLDKLGKGKDGDKAIVKIVS